MLSRAEKTMAYFKAMSQVPLISGNLGVEVLNASSYLLAHPRRDAVVFEKIVEPGIVKPGGKADKRKSSTERVIDHSE
jgi:uncharacterized membrane protein (UPF0136 family)